MNTLTSHNWILTVGTFLPIAGVIAMMFIPKRDESMIKGVAIITAAATLAVGIATLIWFDYGQADAQQFSVSTSWIKPIRATYTIGLDGISLPLYILSMVITLVVMI